MQRDEIIIRSAIMHILDSKVGMPVLSDELLALSPDLNDLIRGLIFKIAVSDDLKNCEFTQGESEVFAMISGFDENNMVEISQNLGRKLYDIMNTNIEIPPADFMVVTYQVQGQISLALLKMNYKESYVHLTGSTEEGSHVNDIIKQTATLPSPGQKLSEAVLINLNDYSVQIVEKKYEINGKKANYLSELFLHCHAKMSEKTKMNIVTRAVEQINNKYFEDDFNKKMEAKSVIQNQVEEEGSLFVETIAQEIYGELPEIKEEFEEKLEKYNIQTDIITPKNETTTKKFQKQFLTTDTGIEINIPMDQYNENENVEFVTNPDGTISIIIKNVNHITTK